MVSKCCCQNLDFKCPFGELEDRGVREHIFNEHCIAKEYVLDLKDLTMFEGNDLRDDEDGRRMYFCMNTFAGSASRDAGSIFIMGTKSIGVPEDSLCCFMGQEGQECVYSPNEAICHIQHGISAEYSHRSQVEETAFLRTEFSGLYGNKQWYYDNTTPGGGQGGLSTTRRPVFAPQIVAGVTGIHPVLSAPMWTGFTGTVGSLRGRILATHTNHTGSVKVTEDQCELYDETDEWYKKIRLFVFMPGASAACHDQCWDVCPFSVKLRCPSHSPCTDSEHLSIHCFSEGNMDLDPGKIPEDFVIINGVKYNTADENYKYGNFGPKGVWLDHALPNCPFQLDGPDSEDGRCCAYNTCYDKNNLPWQITDPNLWGEDVCQDTLFGEWSQRGLCGVNPCLHTCVRGNRCEPNCYDNSGEGCVVCGPPSCEFIPSGPDLENGRCCVNGTCYDSNNSHPIDGFIVNAEQCDNLKGRWSQKGACEINPCLVQCPITNTCGEFCTNPDCTGVCNFPTAFSDPICPMTDLEAWIKTHHLTFTECEEPDSIREFVCCPPCYKDCNGPLCGNYNGEISEYPCCHNEINGDPCPCPPCTDTCGVGTECCGTVAGYGTCPDDCPEVGPWQCNNGKCPCPCPTCETDCDAFGQYNCCGYYNCPCPCDDNCDVYGQYGCCGQSNCPCPCDECGEGCCGIDGCPPCSSDSGAGGRLI